MAERSSERGSILVLAAVSMSLLLAVLALLYSASSGYDVRNRLSGAADAAAKSAAIELQRDPAIGSAALFSVAQAEVQRAIDAGLAPASTVLESGRPCSDVGTEPCTTLGLGYEVVLGASSAGFFGFPMSTPRIRAVAGVANPANCIVTTEDATVDGNLSMQGCGARIGGNLTGGGRFVGIPTPVITVAHSCTDCGAMGDRLYANTMFPPLVPEIATPPNPPQQIPPRNLETEDPSGCLHATENPIKSGCYASIAPSVTTIESGSSILLTGDWMVGDVVASNVLVHVASSGKIHSGGGHLSISAQSGGAFPGIAIYGDSGAQLDATNFSLALTGAVYMPQSVVHLGAVDATACSVVLAETLTVQSDGVFSNAGCLTLFGQARFLGVALAE